MKTTTNEMAAEFAANATPENRARLAELIKAYDDAVTGYNAQEDAGNAVYDRVLAAGEFRAAEDARSIDISKGDRITDHRYDFLLSRADFDRLLIQAAPLLVEEGITDENGYYKTDWLSIKCDARRALVAFFIDHMAPAALWVSLSLAKGNITQEHKLIEIARKIA